ncbi:MAG: cell division protein ZapE, partial [Alteromonadaceae bacterium]
MKNGYKMIKLSPLQQYNLDLKREDFYYDAAQENAVKQLQRLYEDLENKPVAVSGFKKVLNRWKKVYAKPEVKSIKG